MGPWSIERLIRNGRTEFHLRWGGDLDDFQALETLIRREFAAIIRNCINGPCGETILEVSLADHDITLCFDGGYDMIFCFPVNECDVELTQAFTTELQLWQWRNATDPQPMLTFLRDSGKLSERKARLFAVACCRRIWHLLTDERSRRAVEVAEQYADGRATAQELMSAARTADGVKEGSGNALTAVSALMDTEEFDAAEVPMFAASAVECNSDYPSSLCDWEAEKVTQATLLRDVFGNTFRSLPALAPSRGSTVLRLARAAYEERELPSGHLDRTRLGVLADALEEAGADAELVGHLREPGPHVRGCHVVDLILGRS